MRTHVRPFAALLLAVAVVTCTDSPTAAPGARARGRATVAFAPRFASSAARAEAVYETNGLVLDGVEVIAWVANDTLADTTIAYAATDSTLVLPLALAVSPGDTVQFALHYLHGAQVLYSGSGSAAAVVVGARVDNPTSVVLIPVGPGARAASVTVSPTGGSFSTAAPISFAASVMDSSKATIANAVVAWSVSDTSLSRIGGGTGILQPTGKRGTDTVFAVTLDGIGTQVAIALVPPPARVVATSGAGQTGAAGTTLSQPLVVQLQATDGVGVSGQLVTFSISGGGSVNPTSKTTDANGNAQTTVTLGTTSGQDTITATSLGFSVNAVESDTAAALVSLSVVSGSGQGDSTNQQLPAPLVVKAADAFGNGKSGVTVAWTHTGNGTLSASSTTTASDGTASVTYTVGSTAETDSITAKATGVSTPAVFTETATGPARTIAVSPPQSGNTFSFHTGSPPSSPVVVVADAQGHPVPGYKVAITATYVSSGSTNVMLGTITIPTGSDGTISLLTPGLAVVGSFPQGTYILSFADPSGRIVGSNLPAPLTVVIVP